MPVGLKTLTPCSYFLLLLLCRTTQSDSTQCNDNRITSVKSLCFALMEPFFHPSTTVSRFACWSSVTREDDEGFDLWEEPTAAPASV